MLKSELIKQLLFIKGDLDVRLEDWGEEYRAPLSDFMVSMEAENDGKEYIILEA